MPKCLSYPEVCESATIQWPLLVRAEASMIAFKMATRSKCKGCGIYRGSYMSAHVLLNLLNELGKRDKMRGLSSILSLFRNEFNKFNNTRARMLDSIYTMTLRLL